MFLAIRKTDGIAVASCGDDVLPIHEPGDGTVQLGETTVEGCYLVKVPEVPDDYADGMFAMVDGLLVRSKGSAFELSPMQFHNRIPVVVEAACMRETKKLDRGEDFDALLVVAYARAQDRRANTVNVSSPNVIQMVDAVIATVNGATEPPPVSQEERDAWLAPYPAPGET